MSRETDAKLKSSLGSFTKRFVGGAINTVTPELYNNIANNLPSLGETGKMMINDLRVIKPVFRRFESTRNRISNDSDYEEFSEATGVDAGNGNSLSSFINEMTGEEDKPSDAALGAKYVGSSIKKGNSELIFYGQKNHSEVMGGISNISASMSTIIQFSQETVGQYFSESLNLQQNIYETLNEIKDSVVGSKKGNLKDDFSNPYWVGGNFNIGKYIGDTWKNTKGVAELIKTGFEGMGGIPGLLGMGLVNLMPGVKDSLNKLDKSVNKSLGNLIESLAKRGNDGIGGLLSFFFPNASMYAHDKLLAGKDNLNFSQYKQMDIDIEMENKKAFAITEVIPGYLSTITKLMSDGAIDMVVDYNKRAFVRSSKANDKINRAYNDNILGNTQEDAYNIFETVKTTNNNAAPKDRLGAAGLKSMENSIYRILELCIYYDNDEFDPRKTTYVKACQLGLDETAVSSNAYSYIQKIMKKMSDEDYAKFLERRGLDAADKLNLRNNAAKAMIDTGFMGQNVFNYAGMNKYGEFRDRDFLNTQEVRTKFLKKAKIDYDSSAYDKYLEEEGLKKDDTKTTLSKFTQSMKDWVTDEDTEPDSIKAKVIDHLKLKEGINYLDDKANQFSDYMKDKLETPLDKVGKLTDIVSVFGKDVGNRDNKLEDIFKGVGSSIKDLFTGGAGARGTDPDYYNQNDPRWGNNSFGMYNGHRDTVGAGGCGPTVAAMAIQKILNGRGPTITPDVMAQYALASGYKGSGTSPGFFNHVGRQFGIPFTETQGFSNYAATALQNHSPVVLMGHDSRGTSPYGSGTHYLLGTGLSSRGIDILDPQNPNNNGTHPLSEIADNTLMSMVPGRGDDNKKEKANRIGYILPSLISMLLTGNPLLGIAATRAYNVFGKAQANAHNNGTNVVSDTFAKLLNGGKNFIDKIPNEKASYLTSGFVSMLLTGNPLPGLIVAKGRRMLGKNKGGNGANSDDDGNIFTKLLNGGKNFIDKIPNEKASYLTSGFVSMLLTGSPLPGLIVASGRRMLGKMKGADGKPGDKKGGVLSGSKNLLKKLFKAKEKGDVATANNIESQLVEALPDNPSSEDIANVSGIVGAAKDSVDDGEKIGTFNGGKFNIGSIGKAILALLPAAVPIVLSLLGNGKVGDGISMSLATVPGILLGSKNVSKAGQGIAATGIYAGKAIGEYANGDFQFGNKNLIKSGEQAIKTAGVISKLMGTVSKIVTKAATKHKWIGTLWAKISPRLTGKLGEVVAGKAAKGVLSKCAKALPYVNLVIYAHDFLKMIASDALSRELFELPPDFNITGGMKLAAAIVSLIDSIAFGLLDITGTRSLVASFIYKITSSNGAELEQGQAQQKANYQNYIKANGISEDELSFDKYNDLTNRAGVYEFFDKDLDSYVKSKGLGNGNYNKVEVNNVNIYSDSVVGGGFGYGRAYGSKDIQTTLNTAAIALNKSRFSPAMSQSINGHETSLNNGKKWYQKLFSGIGDMFRNIFGGGGRGFDPDYYNQNDPRWGNNSFGMYNGHRDTISDGGCGPTVAAMALQKMVNGRGQIITPDQMARDALASGYKLDNDGTSPAFFDHAGKKYGISFDQNRGLSYNALQSLSRNNPVVLMGHDSYNPSPYGPGTHYLLGTGLDRDGNISILDPQNAANNGKLPLSTIADNTLMSIVPRRGRGRYGRGSIESFNNLIQWMATNSYLNENKYVRVNCLGQQYDGFTFSQSYGNGGCVKFVTDSLNAAGFIGAYANASRTIRTDYPARMHQGTAPVGTIVLFRNKTDADGWGHVALKVDCTIGGKHYDIVHSFTAGHRDDGTYIQEPVFGNISEVTADGRWECIGWAYPIGGDGKDLKIDETSSAPKVTVSDTPTNRLSANQTQQSQISNATSGIKQSSYSYSNPVSTGDYDGTSVGKLMSDVSNAFANPAYAELMGNISSALVGEYSAAGARGVSSTGLSRSARNKYSSLSGRASSINDATAAVQQIYNTSGGASSRRIETMLETIIDYLANIATTNSVIATNGIKSTGNSLVTIPSTQTEQISPDAKLQLLKEITRG